MSPASPAVRRYGDLAVLGAIVLANLALLPVGAPAVLQWSLGIALLLVLPGYAIVAAVFSMAPAGTRQRAGGGRALGPGWPIRAALSLALSLLVVATVGVVLSATVGIRHVPAILAVSVVTVVSGLIAADRRRSLAPESCGNPLRGGVDLSPASFGQTTVQSAVMLLALVALVSAVAFAGSAPSGGETYSEFYVLSEGEDGELVAEGHPSTFVAGEGHELAVGIENEEGETVTYDVVVVAQPNGTTADAEELQRFTVRVDDGERVVVDRTVAPTTVANRTRLQFLFYEDGVGGEPTAETADEALHVWADVVESA